ncbi:ABC transporter substrate-binding protein [Modestobacter lapidis]|nr:iron-siderophore ABC transporter substrate-binding protein [Modestobacter lapidis]
MPNWTRGATLAVAATLTLTACGGSDPGGDAAGPTEPAAESRTVQHALGETVIEGTPERVVVLDTGELDAALALGVTPVGSVRTDVSDELPAYIQDAGVDPADIENVGTIAEPNLEAIAALDPDLILTNRVRHEDIADQLSAIAPTVFAEAIGETWKENLLLDAEALNLSDKAEQLLAEHEERAAEVGALFGDPADLEVSIVRFLDGSGVRLYGEGSFIGAVLADVGFSRPPLQQTAETFVELSLEEITRADADLVFYSSYGEEGGSVVQQVTGGRLWQGMPSVQEGRAHEVGDDRWFLAIGPLGAGLVLDDLAEIAAAGS